MSSSQTSCFWPAETESERKTCLQSAWTRLQMITVSTHTNPIRSLGNYEHGQSALKSRFEKQIRTVCWLVKRLTGKEKAEQNSVIEKNSGLLSNKSKCYTAPAYCDTVHTLLHSTKMLLTSDFKDRPFLHTHTHTHITNASGEKKKTEKEKTLGTKK